MFGYRVKPEPKVILHIGHSKTGSTSIQESLSMSRERLLQEGILYPKIRFKEINHRALSPVVCFDNQRNALMVRMGKDRTTIVRQSQAEWEAVFRQVKKNRPQVVILSAENLFRDLGPHQGKILQELIGTITRRSPRVLAYVRSPASFYLSRLQQFLKGGKGLHLPSPYNKAAVIASYVSFFPNCVEVRAFERQQLLDSDAVSDFADWLGIPSLKADFAGRNSNESVSAEAISILFRLAPLQAPKNLEQVKRQNELSKTVKRLDQLLPQPTKPVLRPRVRAEVNALNTDFEQLQDLYGLNYQDFDYGSTSRNRKKPNAIQGVEDICTFDVDRRDLLEEQVRRALAAL